MSTLQKDDTSKRAKIEISNFMIIGIGYEAWQAIELDLKRKYENMKVIRFTESE